MKILVTSDFHTDVNAAHLPTLADADVLVVAGDLSQADAIAPNVAALCKQFPHVVYVAGNHEYYDSTWENTNVILTSLAMMYPNFHWLNKSTVTIDGQRFVGATLWFHPTDQAKRYAHTFSDFWAIKGIRDWIWEESLRAQQYLKETVTSKDIVVSHHAPSKKSISIQYLHSEMNAFYVCDIEDLIVKSKPKLWIHGHMHAPVDYKIGRTRILANPYGYVGRFETDTFNPSQIIDIKKR